MITTIGYIRVSTDEQVREGVSLENQEEKIRDYCKLKDFEIIEIIQDAGISAKNLRRPGAQRVIGMAQEKIIDAVVVYKLDRMFRSTVDALETTKQFDKWNVSFHSIKEALDTKSAMGKFFFTLTAALAEMEREIIGERTKDGPLGTFFTF
jgi:site-specific DNA recombinase